MRSIGRAITLALFAIGAAVPAQAELATKPVVELFTSQGCSSCPPADELLGKLAQRKDIIALTFNVDYWDYLGWRDTLGKAEFSARQRRYARSRGDGAVYTPQAVVNGRAHTVGSHARRVGALLHRAATTKDMIAPKLSVRQKNGMVVISVSQAGKPLPDNATVYVAGVQPSVTVPIRRGENRGRTITYTNVVRKLMAVGTWTGEATEIQVDPRTIMAGKVSACAVLVQAGDAGPIYAAAWLDR